MDILGMDSEGKGIVVQSTAVDEDGEKYVVAGRYEGDGRYAVLKGMGDCSYKSTHYLPFDKLTVLATNGHGEMKEPSVRGAEIPGITDAMGNAICVGDLLAGLGKQRGDYTVLGYVPGGGTYSLLCLEYECNRAVYCNPKAVCVNDANPPSEMIPVGDR